MDFCALLHVAQKNENGKQKVSCYQTKFAPPKKESKQSKALSENIKKFLKKKEDEERKKMFLEKKKKDNLLAMRDQKAQNRINKHLKVCKAANKSAIADAIDNENTAVTMAGPSQPDEDDYGYTSREASAFYDRLMNKYSNMPPEKPLYSGSGKKSVKDIASTKDRVKQALKQQELEELQGHRRKKKSKDGESSSKSEKDQEFEREPTREKEKESEKEFKPKPKKKLAPPPMDFMSLLKLAEKKQHEPIVIEVKPKPAEPEKLMTKKQMKEYQKEKEWREGKERRKLGENTKSSSPSDSSKPSKSQPSTSKTSKQTIEKAKADSTSSVSSKTSSLPKKAAPRISAKELLEERKKLDADKKALEEMKRSIEEEKKKLEMSKMKKLEESRKVVNKPGAKSKESEVGSLKNSAPKQNPVDNNRPKESSMYSKSKPKPAPMKNERRLAPMNKRNRIESDEEYDSDLADFIDDGPENNGEDYSKYISEIFGYDRNKYRPEEDDIAMESNWHQQMREEHHSRKMGIMEDLEDIARENEEKKRKAAMRKKLKK